MNTANQRRWVVSFVVLLAGVCLCAQSPPKNGVRKQDGSFKTQKPDNGEQNKCATQLVIPPITCQISPEEASANAAKLTQDGETQRKLARYTEWLVAVGAFQILALVFQAVVFCSTLRQTKDSSQRELRAYVGVSECVLRAEYAGQFEGQLRIKNFGKTPASKVRQWIGVSVDTHPPPKPLPEASRMEHSSVSTIWPGLEHRGFVPDLPKAFTKFAPGGPGRSVYIYGKITYDDIFGKAWKTEYRFVLDGTNGIQSVRDSNNVPILLMQPDESGNEAT